MISINKKTVIATAAAISFFVTAAVVHSNVIPELNKSTVVCPTLPETFDGFTVAQISDLHNAELGKNNSRVIALLEDAAPDVIVITGDLIDSRRTDVATALGFVNQATEIAPCYFVAGNHESRVEEYSELRQGLESAGVTVLDGKCIEIEKDGLVITLAGFNDPTFKAKADSGSFSQIADEELKKMNVAQKDFVILLAHRPELFEVYARHEVDLVFSGHAHGGQFRLPFFGGLYVPNQGLFPKYDSGIYESGKSRMIVSRGIGNSIMPVRINNRPEVVAVELKTR